VNAVATVPAVLAAIGLLVFPGLAFLASMRRSDREALTWDEVVFLIAATGVMAASWVGLVLAEAGRFSLVTAAAIVAGASVVMVVVRGGRLRLGGARRPGAVAAAGLVAALGLSLALHTRPSEYIVGGRDPGTYVAAMGLIARHGGIVYTDPTVLSIPRQDVELFYRNPDSPPFTWTRFIGFPLESPFTGRVFPLFFHLFPVFGAYLFQAMGIKGALATPVVFGVLGTMAVVLALRRVFDPWVSLVAGALLAGNVLQVWFARFPLSEGMSQFLVFTGIWALTLWEDRGSTWFGALAGMALGLSLLVRIDTVLIAVPLAAYLAIRRVRGDLPWRRMLCLVVPLALLGMHTGLHAWLWSTKYVVSIMERPYWRQPLWVWVVVALALGLIVAAAHSVGPRLAPLVRRHETALRRGAAVAVVALALYAYFLRPMLSAWAGADGNDPSLALTHRAWLQALGFRRLASQDAQAFLRLGWFIHPLGLALAVAGAMWVALRGTRQQLFLSLTVAVFGGFYFYKMRVWNDYFFAARRFLPVILPGALAFAAVALVRLAGRSRWRQALAAGLAGTLGVSFALDTRLIVDHVDYRTMVGQVEQLGRLFGPDDLVIFEHYQSIHLLSLPLWALHGTQVLELARFNPDPAELHDALAAWQKRYANIYFVYTYRSEQGLCGVFLQRVRDFLIPTVEWERSYTGFPRRPIHESLRFTVSRMILPEQVRVPALPELDVGGSDDFQVSGFFLKEGAGERTYRWTGPCASVYMPGIARARAIVVVASVGQRPDRAVVRVSLDGREIGTFTPGSEWGSFRLDLPTDLRERVGLLRFDVSPWRPGNVLPDSSDVRDLGVMIDSIRLEP